MGKLVHAPGTSQREDASGNELIDPANKPERDKQRGSKSPQKPAWREAWAGMPEYEHKDLEPWKSVWVHFRNAVDLADFASTIGQPLTHQTRYIHFPPAERLKVAHQRYVSGKPQNPAYPVYVISKGRWKSRLTSKALEALGVPYHIVVEPQEFEPYAAVIDPAKILVLPFSNLGQGSIPARNWVWEHALAGGAARHWILDDNIRNFFRFNRNNKIRVGDGTIFRAAERFVDRYENVALAGFNYYMFLPRKCGAYPAFKANTRIYSTILIRNDIPYRWRGRYNEDTDLSLRVLKDGLCTIQFNAFLSEKMRTMKMAGGNTEELYAGDGRLPAGISGRKARGHAAAALRWRRTVAGLSHGGGTRRGHSQRRVPTHPRRGEIHRKPPPDQRPGHAAESRPAAP